MVRTFSALHDQLVIQHERISDFDFTGLRVKRVISHDSHFSNCTFDNARVNYFCFGSGQVQSTYTDCSFDHVKIRAENPGIARFVRCQFTDSVLTKWLSGGAEFVDCTFTGKLNDCYFDARLSSTYREYLDRSVNEFHGNDFSGAEFFSVGFRGGIDLSSQVMPSGEGHLLIRNAEPVVRSAINEIREWEGSLDRREALIMLELGLETILGGQRDLFISSHDWVSRDGSRERIYSRLRAVLAEASQSS